MRVSAESLYPEVIVEGFVCLGAPCGDGAFGPLDMVRAAVAAFLAVLFLQSGIDKVVDRRGNLEWLTGHFAKSPLASLVAPMLGVITLVELAAGLCSALGVVGLLAMGSRALAGLGALLSILAILMLFFGQRMAKDYAGAGALVPYFLLACGGLLLMEVP